MRCRRAFASTTEHIDLYMSTGTHTAEHLVGVNYLDLLYEYHSVKQ